MTRLEKFLNNRKLLERFEYNIIHHPHITQLDVGHFSYENGNMYNAFFWSNSPEGHWYWRYIEEEWINCLKQGRL